MNKPIERAMSAFDDYAAMDAPDLPVAEMPKLQVRLCRWQSRNFGPQRVDRIALGVSEEAGELCHAVLKHAQSGLAFACADNGA